MNTSGNQEFRAPMMSQEEFLQPDVEQIRHQIRGVLDSYSHDWDLISELVQNSVDAIREKGNGKGHVSIVVDATSRLIKISDNGIGIEPLDLKKLLRPFGTNKRNKPNQVGEKGVGLKFVMFSSTSLKIASKRDGDGCRAEIHDAAAWLRSETGAPLYVNIAEDPGLSQGTTIEIRVENDDHPIFGYSFAELIFLVKTRTACGDTGYVWGEALNCDTRVTHIDQSGKVSEEEFDCRFLLPIDGANKSECISIDEFQTWLKEKDRGDSEKRRKLLNKIVFTVGKTWRAGREVRYWSCFVPRREFWRLLSLNVGLAEPEEEALANGEVPSVGFSGGLGTSTKGMPTGIAIELKPRGSAGYVPNFYMIMDDPSLKFDIGRKAVQGRQQGMLREIAYDNFRDYINITRKYMGGSIDQEATNWDRDEVFEEISGLPNLDSTETKFVKRPNSQEATVAAIFFEQLGKGRFEDLSPLISGYKGRYDLYAKWKTVE